MLDATFFGAVHQIGYAVRDVDHAIEHYRKLDGSAHEFNRFEVVLDSSNGYRYLGHPAASPPKDRDGHDRRHGF
jgi:hypothetical protein